MSVLSTMAIQSSQTKVKLKIMYAVDKPLDEMSVKEICEKAGISRDTFYRHFSSKYDIAIWHGKLIQGIYLDDAGRSLDLHTGYTRHLHIMSEEYAFYQTALKHFGRLNNEFPEMCDHRKRTLTETLTKWKNLEIDGDMQFCIDAFVQLETLLVARWLGDGCTPDPDTFATRMVSVIPNRLYDAWKL